MISPNCHNHNPVLFFPNVTFRFRIITRIVPTRLIQQVSQGMQDRPTLLENLRLTPDFGGVSVAQSLVFYLAFCLLLFVLLILFLFCLCVFYLFSTQEFISPFSTFRHFFLFCFIRSYYNVLSV